MDVIKDCTPENINPDVPLVLLFFAAQKYFVEGIATSGLKG